MRALHKCKTANWDSPLSWQIKSNSNSINVPKTAIVCVCMHVQTESDREKKQGREGVCVRVCVGVCVRACVGVCVRVCVGQTESDMARE